MDDGFAYRVPETLEGVDVGSIVRVPLGGRRVRGYVTDVRDTEASRPLRDVLRVSGDLPVFDRRLLATARWAAAWYVAPLSVILSRCAPPRLPKRLHHSALPPVPAVTPPFPGLEEDGRRTRCVVWGGPVHRVVAPLAAPVLAAGRNVLVVAATVAEAEEAAAGLGSIFGARVLLATSAAPAAVQTSSWSTAATGAGYLLVGTREVAFWPAGEVDLAVVAGDGRPGLRSPQTPTFEARAVLRRRAGVERFRLVLVSVVPSCEALASGCVVVEPPGRAWPLVEIADRREEPPGGGVVLERARVALRATVRRGGRAFVLTRRRGYAVAFRCTSCGELRRCPVCGAAVDREGRCPRCDAERGGCSGCGGRRFVPVGAGVGRVVEELRGVLGDEVTGPGGAGRVLVGTERDLVGMRDLDLAVAVDTDGLVFAPTYRAGEEALRLLARLAATVGRGRGRRCLVQTSAPSHPVLVALRGGRPVAAIRHELEERSALGLPPVGELVAVECRPQTATTAVDRALRAAVGADGELLGPAPAGPGSRWLIRGGDLSRVRVRLRAAVGRLRDQDIRVRIDVDPREP